MLQHFRLSNGLTDDDHTRTLTSLNWSLGELEAHFSGESRAVVFREYSDLIRRMMAMPTVSPAVNDSFEMFCKDRGITEVEHLRALEKLEIIPERFDAHRVPAMRSALRKLKVPHISSRLFEIHFRGG